MIQTMFLKWIEVKWCLIYIDCQMSSGGGGQGGHNSMPLISSIVHHQPLQIKWWILNWLVRGNALNLPSIKLVGNSWTPITSLGIRQPALVKTESEVAIKGRDLLLGGRAEFFHAIQGSRQVYSVIVFDQIQESNTLTHFWQGQKIIWYSFSFITL